MYNNALKSEKLYDEMRAAGYQDDEFPVWWFSPARDEGQISVKGQVSEIIERLEEVPPRIPASKEDRITRPTLSPDHT